MVAIGTCLTRRSAHFGARTQRPDGAVPFNIRLPKLPSYSTHVRVAINTKVTEPLIICIIGTLGIKNRFHDVVQHKKGVEFEGMECK